MGSVVVTDIDLGGAGQRQWNTIRHWLLTRMLRMNP